MIIYGSEIHVSRPARLSSLAMQVGGVWGRSPLGKQGGFEDRSGQDRMEQDRTKQDRTGQHRTGQDRAGQDRTG